MTETTITPHEAFMSKAKFSEFMSSTTPAEIEQVLSEYKKPDGKVMVHVAELTQNFETLFNALGDPSISKLPKAPSLVWTITSEKENIMNVLKTINKHSSKGFGIFVFKAHLNEDKIAFECLLKPETQTKPARNENTPAKLVQNDYWEQYFEVCDALTSEMQVTPAPRHYQYISIGKSGVQIMQTISTKDKYIATELFINNDKNIFDKLFESKDEIEEKLGNLIWQRLEGKKSSRIRQVFDIDVLNQEKRENVIKIHIKMAEDFKLILAKYLK